MKRLLATGLLCLSLTGCVVSQADIASVNDEAAFKKYIASEWQLGLDLETVEVYLSKTPANYLKADDSVKMWVRYHYTSEQALPPGWFKYRAAAYEYGINCREAEVRITFASFYPSTDFNSELVRSTSTPNDPLRRVIPSSIDAALQKWACK